MLKAGNIFVECILREEFLMSNATLNVTLLLLAAQVGFILCGL
jgi:hypothetical protein